MKPSSPGAVALIVAGSGPTDRDGNSIYAPGNNSLRRLAQELGKRGIATVRYDKRAVGASTQVAEDQLCFQTYVQDAVRWVEKLNNDSRFSNVLIVGHSEGALIALLAAQQSKASAVVSIAGMSISAQDHLRMQLKGKLPSELAGVCEEIIAGLERGRPFADPPPALQAIFRESVQPYLISWFKYRPTEVIQRTRQDVLIVHGSADMQVPMESAQQLKEARPQSRLRYVEGMDHFLSAPACSGSRSGAAAVAQEISDFIKSSTTFR